MPAWGVRTAIMALRSFMEQPSEGQVGGMDMDDASRRKLADQSRKWKCEECGKTNEEILKESAEAAAKVEGGKKLEDTVPAELKMGYREDIEKKDKVKEVEDSPAVAARKARADAAAARVGMSSIAEPATPERKRFSEESLRTREENARDILSHVGISRDADARTPPAPTREDAEEIARIREMFPPARPSPIPRHHQSPNQLEPVIGSPPPIYRRHIPGQAAPDQPAPAPTVSTSSSFHNDAFPPYMNHPHSRPPSIFIPSGGTTRAGTPLTESEYLDETRRTWSGFQRQQSYASGTAASASSRQQSFERSANLSPEQVRERANAAARQFENMGANMGIRQRERGPATQVLSPEERVERLRQQEAGHQPQQGQQEQAQVVPPANAVPAYQRVDVTTIDTWIVALCTALGIVVIKLICKWYPGA